MPAADTSRLERWLTTQEIVRQPEIWTQYGPTLYSIAEETRTWLKTTRYDEVWFCGAGTSAFIGEILVSHLNRAPGPARFRAIPTTDLVASPQTYLRGGVRLLVVLFGRSGNSPETIGALDALATLTPDADRLHITCNPDSALGRQQTTGEARQKTIILPPETDDQGFAMTSSYTTMLLTALACFESDPLASVTSAMDELAAAAQHIVKRIFPALSVLATPGKAVFLGSGPLTGAARESALKALELSAGKIATMWDSTLGFRHGPKAIVDDETTIFVFVSSDPLTQAYDRDLIDELRAQYGERRVIRLGPHAWCDWLIPQVGNDAWSAVLYVLVAQMLATIWSDRLGLNVDNPFSSGFLTRVVSGVRLHAIAKSPPTLVGGIDVGGSKIESRLFDGKLNELARRRVPTVKSSYPELVDAVCAELAWLEQQAGTPISVGIGIPGLIDRGSGVWLTANLPATGHRMSADLSARLNRSIPVENDCKCFALSEAIDGAGSKFRTVFGLVLGTGIGGGVCVDGKLAQGLNNLAGEVGHFGLPAFLLEEENLPLVSCGCGRAGCYETYLSGPGMTRLGTRYANRLATPSEIVAAADDGDRAMAQAYRTWLRVLAEMIRTVQLTVDPDCIVLGGGLSQIAGLSGALEETFIRHRIAGVRSPHFAIAKYGDSSGVRGAAMLALSAQHGTHH